MDYDAPLTELHPGGSPPQRPLRGLYLDLPLRPSGRPDGLFVYSNFVTSLDGRIAVESLAQGVSGVPEQTANPRDWRLFQELAGRADVLVTSGRYLRQLEAGTAQEVLPVGAGDDFADIRAWRRNRGMAEQPDVAVVSASLAFHVPESLLKQRRMTVLTGVAAPASRKQALRDRGLRVLECEPGPGLTGAGIARALEQAGYGNAYCVTGPQILRLLVADGVLDTLFLTLALRLLGGHHYDTILEGELLATPASFTLRTLFHDNHAPDGAAQLLACFDRCQVSSHNRLSRKPGTTP